MERVLEAINKAPNSVKWGGLAALVVAMTAVNFFFFVQDAADTIARQLNEQRSLETQLAEKKSIADNLNDRRKEMDQLEQKLQEALTELPEKKDIDELLAQLNDVGKKSGLEIARVEPNPEQQESFFARIPVKMVVAGNYHEIALFFQEVANMRRIVNVNNIKLGVSSNQTHGEKVILNSEFLATTFRFAEPKKDDKKKSGAGGAKPSGAGGER
jgi:type IV pilus assembly protein PilO